MSKVKWKIAQYLEFKWWQHYLSDKNKKDYLAWKKNYWKEFIKNHIEPHIDIQNEAINVLDAGCGPAGIFIVLSQKNIDALDPLIYQYEQLPHFYPANYPNVRFINVSLEKFKPEKKYELIFCLNAINHVAHLEQAVTQLMAGVDHRSVLFISTDVHKYYWLKKILQWIPVDALHPQQYDTINYTAFFKSKKLIVKEVKTIRKGLIFDYVLFILKKKL